MKPTRICGAEGCGEHGVTRFDGVWYCNKHYCRLVNHGDTNLHPRGRTTQLIKGDNGTAIIVTSNGQHILIDEADIDKAMRYSWCVSKTGYAVANIDGHVTKMHRYLLGLTSTDAIVDHINGNPLDNRRVNLRLCSNAENMRNMKAKKSISGATGVRLTSHGRWNARITINGKGHHIGNYQTKGEAIQARREAEQKYFGEFAPSLSRGTEGGQDNG